MALWPAAYEEPHLQVGYMAAPTSNCRALNRTLANGEPSIHDPNWTHLCRDVNGSFAPHSGHGANFASAWKQTLQLTTLEVVVAPRSRELRRSQGLNHRHQHDPRRDEPSLSAQQAVAADASGLMVRSPQPFSPSSVPEFCMNRLPEPIGATLASRPTPQTPVQEYDQSNRST